MRLALSALILAASAAPAASQTLIPAPLPAASLTCAAVHLPKLPVCVATPRGLIFAPDRVEAERNAAFARAGEARFKRHFGRDTPPYALIIRQLTPDVRTTLRAAGIKAVLPWITADQQRAAHAEAVHRAAEARAKAAGPDSNKTAQAADAP
ncbi:MAG: hypothetical protein KY449_10035 [Proteobacteria bacterium]|nr:hypothetical protein [Pseudomonadota bacterium]